MLSVFLCSLFRYFLLVCKSTKIIANKQFIGDISRCHRLVHGLHEPHRALSPRRLRSCPLRLNLSLQVAIEEEHCRNEEHIGSHPGHRVAIADAEESQGGYEPEAHADARHHLHDAAEHRQVAVAEALNAVAENGEHTKSGIEIVGYAHEHRGIGDDLLLAAVDEEFHHLVGKGIDERHRQDEIYEHDAQGGEDAKAHTGRIAGPDILSAVGGHSQTDILEDAGEEIFYAHRRRKGGHTRGDEAERHLHLVDDDAVGAHDVAENAARMVGEPDGVADAVRHAGDAVFIELEPFEQAGTPDSR